MSARMTHKRMGNPMQFYVYIEAIKEETHQLIGTHEGREDWYEQKETKRYRQRGGKETRHHARQFCRRKPTLLPPLTHRHLRPGLEYLFSWKNGWNAKIHRFEFLRISDVQNICYCATSVHSKGYWVVRAPQDGSPVWWRVRHVVPIRIVRFQPAPTIA